MLNAFSIARLPRIEFAPGAIQQLPRYIFQFGRRALIVTGGRSFIDSEHWTQLEKNLKQQGIAAALFSVTGEPSPQLVDDCVKQFSDQKFDVVIGIGGGSALDAAKAIAGLLISGQSVMDFLEGVGPELPYTGPAVPLIAVPTTAGTGSEATKNAVLSVQGKQGFKKSFRDDKLVAEYAILDPNLLESCPSDLIAANGMDALTQLMESYVSTRANPFTDALAMSGLHAVRDSLLPWYRQEGDTTKYRGQMAYAAMLSGITLAQCGLGSVHGLASPLGAFYPIPHGVVCGTLVAEASVVNINSMLQREPENSALAKYAEMGRVLAQSPGLEETEAQQALISLLHQWTEQMQLARLSSYGVKQDELDHVVQHSRGSSMKTNPIVLTDAEIKSLLESRL
ncbi:MAG: iron-containing alcohol dehydrogenase [Gammaproteobacteria bacterium]|nr:iron-containing alcohol dehydrogenase [Gammaproteobacteria bacterium]